MQFSVKRPSYKIKENLKGGNKMIIGDIFVFLGHEL